MKEYRSIKQVAEALSVDVRWVRTRVKEMRQFVGYGKEYPPSALISADGINRVDVEAFADFCNRKEELCGEK